MVFFEALDFHYPYCCIRINEFLQLQPVFGRGSLSAMGLRLSFTPSTEACIRNDEDSRFSNAGHVLGIP